MSNPPPRLSRSDLLAAMEVNWGRFLATVNALTDEERQTYAAGHGFDSLKDLLAHVCAQFERTLASAPAGAAISRADAQAEPRDYRRQTLGQLEEDFEQLWTGVAGMIADLPDSALRDAEVYNWLYNTAVEQYEAIEPPGDPQTPSEQHAQVRPEPGDHATTSGNDPTRL